MARGAGGVRIKICFLMYHGSMQSGGQGIYLANVTRELTLLGHEVHAISGPPYPVLDAAVKHHRLTTHSFPAMLLDTPRFFGERDPLSHLHPFNFAELASTRFTLSSLLATFSLRALRRLAQIEAMHGPFDIVHDNQTLSYGTYLTRALLTRPVVANVHHPLDVDRTNALRDATSLGRRVQRVAWYPWHIQRAVARRLDALISGSRASASLVERLWRLPPGLMHPIYDGVDVETFHPGTADETERGTLLFVGNADDHNKGAVYLLRAMAKLLPSARTHLYMVGGPPSHSRIAAREIDRLGIADCVTVVGRVVDEELAAWYRRAQIVISPSLYEGFGLPAAEAMASGTAVVASDGGALPEVIANGETGVIVPATDIDALADAIASLLAAPERCREMGAAGRQRVLERFTWSQTASSTAAVYRDVLDARGGAPGGAKTRHSASTALG